jgi:hypothetical protein|tara:strand:- start:23393 stop:23806 length:414 start_codon:yes stop_codon:yes gene_type:complete
MDLEQKYTEGNKTLKFDIHFIEELDIYPEDIQEDVIVQLINHEPYLMSEDGYTQEVGGVVKGAVPFFFEIEYLKQEGERAVYLNINPINLDDYLDLIIKKQTLTTHEHTTEEGTEVKGAGESNRDTREEGTETKGDS